MSNWPSTPPNNDNRLVEFLGFVFLEILAAPPAYDGWQSVKVGDVSKAILFYGISALPCIAGIVVISGAWSRTRTNLSRWATGRIYPIATDARYWMALFLVIFVYMATPVLLAQLKSTLSERGAQEQPITTLAVAQPMPTVKPSAPNSDTRPHQRAVGWRDFYPSWPLDLEHRFMGITQPCVLKISAVEEHLDLCDVIKQAATMQVKSETPVCKIVDDEADRSPRLRDIDMEPPPSSGIAIRWNEAAQPHGDEILYWLENIGFKVHKGSALPPKHEPTEIWIDIGPGVLWKEVP